MQKPHQFELRLRLERVADVGCVEISAFELRRWFGRDRITSAIWEAINDEWNEIAENVPLLLGPVGDPASGYVLVWGEKSWLTDIRDYCGKNYNRTTFSLSE
jgi:hypothetical protein